MSKVNEIVFSETMRKPGAEMKFQIRKVDEDNFAYLTVSQGHVRVWGIATMPVAYNAITYLINLEKLAGWELVEKAAN
jgi:hypothetical protein